MPRPAAAATVDANRDDYCDIVGAAILTHLHIGMDTIRRSPLERARKAFNLSSLSQPSDRASWRCQPRKIVRGAGRDAVLKGFLQDGGESHLGQATWLQDFRKLESPCTASERVVRPPRDSHLDRRAAPLRWATKMSARCGTIGGVHPTPSFYRATLPGDKPHQETLANELASTTDPANCC